MQGRSRRKVNIDVLGLFSAFMEMTIDMHLSTPFFCLVRPLIHLSVLFLYEYEFSSSLVLFFRREYMNLCTTVIPRSCTIYICIHYRRSL